MRYGVFGLNSGDYELSLIRTSHACLPLTFSWLVLLGTENFGGAQRFPALPSCHYYILVVRYGAFGLNCGASCMISTPNHLVLVYMALQRYDWYNCTCVTLHAWFYCLRLYSPEHEHEILRSAAACLIETALTMRQKYTSWHA